MATLDPLKPPRNPLEEEDELTGTNTSFNPEGPAAPRSLIGSNISAPAESESPPYVGAPVEFPGTTEGEPAPKVVGDVPPPAPPPENTEPASYTPVLDTVKENETVQGQLGNILNSDNKLMQTARNRAMQTANSRGLLNSSMAAQAGEQAVIDTSLPIAGADAAAYRQASAKNVAAQNEAGLFGAGAQQQLTLQRLKGDQAEELAGIEANYKQMLQASQSASSLFNTVMSNIGAILDDPNTTQEQKQNAVNNQIALLHASLSVMGSIANIDLSALLDFSQLTNVGTPPTTTPTPEPAPAPTPTQVPPIPEGTGEGGVFQDGEGLFWQVVNGRPVPYTQETPG